MMSNYKGLVKLNSVPAEMEIWNGTLFRMYNVQRLDTKETEDDYYDLMLIDLSNYIPQTFALVNVTLNSDNRGRFAAMISNVPSKHFIHAAVIQKYFDPEIEIYFVEDAELLRTGR